MPVERTKGKQTSYLGKLAAYREIVAGGTHKNWLGISSLFILTITTGEQRLSEIIRTFRERGDSPLFLFKAISEHALTVPAPHLLAAPWERTCLASLSIDR
jgi:hypothetical protein